MDGRLKFRAKGDLYKVFAYRLTHTYVCDTRNDFKDGDDSFVDLDGETSSNDEVAKAAVLTPDRVTSAVTSSIDIYDFHLMPGHLNARLLKNSARKAEISLRRPLRKCDMTAPSMSR